MISIETTLRLTAFVSGVYAIFSGLELHELRDMFKDDGIISWKVVALSQDRILSQLYVPLLEKFHVVIIGRMALGAVLIGFVIVGVPAWIYAVVVIPLFATDILTRLRHTAGLSGAYDMSLVINGSLAIALIFAGRPMVQSAALVFIAIQGIFSYSLAGISKFVGEPWRNGEAIEMTFSTKIWGDERVYRFFDKFPWLKQPATLGLAASETLFVLVLFVDPPIVLLFFAVGILFHVANAVFMGINGFLYIFPATYPAIYYVSSIVGISILPL